jgi:peroxiredoxin
MAVGEQVDDFTWLRPDGMPARLSEFANRIIVLIFLRHLA